MEELHLKGECNFIGDKNNSFVGPIQMGFRPIAWIKDVKHATSCSFVSIKPTNIGEISPAEIVLLSPESLNAEIKQGTILSIGSTVSKIAEFKVSEIIGQWDGGKLP